MVASWAIPIKKRRRPMRTGRPKLPMMLSKEEYEEKKKKLLESI